MPRRKNKRNKNSLAPMYLSATTVSDPRKGAAMDTSESGAQKSGSSALNSGQLNTHSIVEGQGNAENQSDTKREFMSMMMSFMKQQVASQEAKAAASKASILQQATILEAMSEEIQRLRYRSAHASSQTSALAPPSPLPKDCSSAPVLEGSLSAFPIAKNKRKKRTQQFCQFIKLKAPHFSGTDNPLDAEGWMEQVVKALKVSGCDTQYWVFFVIYLLEGEAGQWWSSVSSRIKQPIVWEDFVKEFYEKFFPSWYRKRQEIEFLQLEQGSMTVTQYETKFTALSRFALHLILDEEKKVKKFENGLRAELKDKVQAFYCSTYEEMVKKAMIIEEGKLDHKALTAPLPEEAATRQAIALGKRKVATNSCAADDKGRVRRRRKPFQFYCYGCGNVGHIIRNCPHTRQEKLYQPIDAGPITTNSPPHAEAPSSSSEGDFTSDKEIGCSRCGEFDHFVRNCPIPKEEKICQPDDKGLITTCLPQSSPVTSSKEDLIPDDAKWCYRCGERGHMFRNCSCSRQEKPCQPVDLSSITTAYPSQVVVPCSSTQMSRPVNARSVTSTCLPQVVVPSFTQKSGSLNARSITTTCPPQVVFPCSSTQFSTLVNARSITTTDPPQVMVPCSSTEMSSPVSAKSITATCPPLVVVSSSSTDMSVPVSARLITTTCPQKVVDAPTNSRSISTICPPQVMVPCSSTQMSRPVNPRSISTTCPPLVVVSSSSTKMSGPDSARLITTTSPPQGVVPCSSTQLPTPVNLMSITTTFPPQGVLPSRPINARSVTTTCPPNLVVPSSFIQMSGPDNERLMIAACLPQVVVPYPSTQLLIPVNLMSVTTTCPPQVMVPCYSTQTSEPVNAKSITTICTSQVAVPSSTQVSRHVNVRSITTTCPPQSVLPCPSTQMSRPVDARSITTTCPSHMVAPSSSQLSTPFIFSEGDRTLDSKIRCNRCGEPDHILRNCPRTIQEKIHPPADAIIGTSLPQAATPSPPTQFPSLGEPLRIQPDRPVVWRPPHPGTVRLNVDGCSRGNPGPSAVGGIFRDHCGKVLAAFGSFLGSHDSLYVELMAILKGLIYASQLGFSSLEVESDSLPVVDWVTTTNEFWGFAYLIRSIRQLTQQHQIQIKHVPKEANQAADFMANWACSYHITNLFTGTDGLPSGLLDITTFDAKKLSHL